MQPTPEAIADILDLARWAPSGDNLQPWRFEITPSGSVVIHVRDESDCNVYDTGGSPTLISAGCLVESIRLAASQFGWSVTWRYCTMDAHTHSIDIEFSVDHSVSTDPLLAYITTRSVDRRPYTINGITTQQKQTLANALGEGYEIRWFETWQDRLAISRLCMQATRIRLSLHETYVIHARIIDWENRHSEWGIPSRAVGLDALTLRLMKWVMGSWQRVEWMNRYMNGTLTPRIEMDLLPGMLCGAHFMLLAKQSSFGLLEPTGCIELGMRLQRFWLTASQLGLAMQPEFAPVIFGRYGLAGKPFSAHPKALHWSQRLAQQIANLMAPIPPDRLVMMGRLGTVNRPPAARSIRRPLSEMMIAKARAD